MIPKKQFVAEMAQLEEMVRARDNAIDRLISVGFSSEAPIFDVIYALEQEILRRIALSVDEFTADSMCEWFVWETDFGKSPKQAFHHEKEYLIDSSEALYDFLTAWNR